MTLGIGLIALALLQADTTATERTLTVTAVDESGTPVQGLAADEVVVMENGVARTATRFELDRRPLDVAILVDTSQPMATAFRLNQLEAVLQFVRRLPEGAQYAVWTTGDRPTKVVDFGDDPAQADRVLKRVIPSGGNTLLDALVEAARDLKRREERRPVVVAITGTGIGFSDRDRRRVVDEGVATGVQFLAVQFDEAGDADVQAGSEQISRQDYDYVLSELARRSGGRHERVLSALGVRGALDKLVPELSARYRLTYASAGKDDKLEVQVARPGVKVRFTRAPKASPGT
jgi:VWFA-related protein